jgi:hypothetical protein
MTISSRRAFFSLRENFELEAAAINAKREPPSKKLVLKGALIMIRNEFLEFNFGSFYKTSNSTLFHKEINDFKHHTSGIPSIASQGLYCSLNRRPEGEGNIFSAWKSMKCLKTSNLTKDMRKQSHSNLFKVPLQLIGLT